jgi:hypothetical protein
MHSNITQEAMEEATVDMAAAMVSISQPLPLIIVPLGSQSAACHPHLLHVVTKVADIVVGLVASAGILLLSLQISLSSHSTQRLCSHACSSCRNQMSANGDGSEQRRYAHTLLFFSCPSLFPPINLLHFHSYLFSFCSGLIGR